MYCFTQIFLDPAYFVPVQSQVYRRLGLMSPRHPLQRGISGHRLQVMEDMLISIEVSPVTHLQMPVPIHQGLLGEI